MSPGMCSKAPWGHLHGAVQLVVTQGKVKIRKNQEKRPFPDSYHCAIFPRLLQYLQEANELFCDMANPFFLPVYTIDTNRHSQIDLAAIHINSQKTERNGLAVPQASHFTSSDMPYSASRVIRPMEEESKVSILFVFFKI